MKLKYKKSMLITLGLVSLVLSRLTFWFINDPEGPNLLIVTVLALIIFSIALAAMFIAKRKRI
jgi:hypothetical protein